MAKNSRKSSRGRMGDRARERAENRQQSGGGGTKFNFPEGSEITFLVPKKGTMLLDVIPYEVTINNHPAGVEKGELWYQRTIWVHFGIGSEEKKYLCLKTVGKKCPICDARAAMMKEAGADQDLIDALKPKEREIYNVIDLDDRDGKVQLLEMSYHLFGKKLEEELREGDEELASFAELEGGKTLKVRFGEKKMGRNTFLEATRIDFEDRDDYKEDILEEVLNLDEILNVIEYDKLEALFLETDPEEEERESKGSRRNRRDKDKDKDEEEDEGKSRRNRRDKDEEEDEGKSRRNRRDKDKDDEEEERGSRRNRRDKEEEEEKDKEEQSSRRNRRDKEDKDDEEEERGSRRNRRDKDKDDEDKEKKSSGSKCPHGHVFGEEADEHDDCFDCKKWDACREATDEYEADKKKRRK